MDGGTPAGSSPLSRFVTWLRSGHGLSAALAIALGAVTVLAFATTRPGFERLEVAVFLGPIWLLFGFVWLVAFAMTLASKGGIAWRRWVATPVIVGVAFVLTVAGFVAGAYPGGSTVSLTAVATVEGTTLNVGGTTDLPDGSRLWVNADRQDALIGTTTEAIVDKGTYTASLELSRWPNGPIGVTVSFWFDDQQPAEVFDRFGPDGEGLRGPGVQTGSDGPVLRASTTAELIDGLAPWRSSCAPSTGDGLGICY